MGLLEKKTDDSVVGEEQCEVASFGKSLIFQMSNLLERDAAPVPAPERPPGQHDPVAVEPGFAEKHPPVEIVKPAGKKRPVLGIRFRFPAVW